MPGGECLRAEESVSFFAVAEQYDDVILDRRSGPQGADGLENNNQAGAVVRRPRTFSDRVGMSDQHDRAAVGRTGKSGDDVLDESRVESSAIRRGADSLLDMNLGAE